MRISTRATSDGFTLIELTLVLLIIGILLSLVVPRVASLGEAQLDTSARRMAAMISYLHDEAALRGRIYKLSLDLDRERYSIEVQAPYASGTIGEQAIAQWDPYAKAAQLPDGVDLASIETADASRQSGSAEIYFLPEDAMGGVTITLQGRSGRQLTLGVDGVTGRVHIESPTRLL